MEAVIKDLIDHRVRLEHEIADLRETLNNTTERIKDREDKILYLNRAIHILRRE